MAEGDLHRLPDESRAVAMHAASLVTIALSPSRDAAAQISSAGRPGRGFLLQRSSLDFEAEPEIRATTSPLYRFELSIRTFSSKIILYTLVRAPREEH